uniref:Uncharacterized protein n=1 Tax=Dulem virus 29 TaxID=3145747 RepID=A0AAU8AX93_9CAUD
MRPIKKKPRKRGFSLSVSLLGIYMKMQLI